MKKSNDYIYLGEIVNTFGIKGELKVFTESDFIEERFKKGRKVYFKIGKNYEEHTVSTHRVHKKNVLLTIDDLFDINQIEKYVGCEIYASSQDELDLDEDDYYIDDLVDLEVYNTLGDYIGIVTDVLEMPNSYLLEVRGNDKKVLIPFVEAFVKDVTDTKIVIEEIEGLR